METSNQNINISELLKEAEQISDHRNRIFNELKNQIINTLLPALAKVMKGYDRTVVYSTGWGKSAVGNFVSEDLRCDLSDNQFAIAYVTDEETVTIKPAWEEYKCECDGIVQKYSSRDYDIQEVLTKTNAVWFAQDIIEKIKKLNAKYNKETQKMESVSEMIAKDFQ